MSNTARTRSGSSPTSAVPASVHRVACRKLRSQRDFCVERAHTRGNSSKNSNSSNREKPRSSLRERVLQFRRRTTEARQAAILQGIAIAGPTFDPYKLNPEDFMAEAARRILSISPCDARLTLAMSNGLRLGAGGSMPAVLLSLGLRFYQLLHFQKFFRTAGDGTGSDDPVEQRVVVFVGLVSQFGAFLR
jgi:hypothetical protein